jgi:hypothetical protein
MPTNPKSQVRVEQLPHHPAAALFPMMAGPAKVELRESLKKNGQRVAVVCWEDPETGEQFLLDGRNRVAEAFVLPYGSNQVIWLEGDPWEIVLDLNQHRRHLTQAQTREAIAKLDIEKPEWSDRRIGAALNADHKTVGKVRQHQRGESPEPQPNGQGGESPRDLPRRGSEIIEHALRLAIAKIGIAAVREVWFRVTDEVDEPLAPTAPPANVPDRFADKSETKTVKIVNKEAIKPRCKEQSEPCDRVATHKGKCKMHHRRDIAAAKKLEKAA